MGLLDWLFGGRTRPGGAAAAGVARTPTRGPGLEVVPLADRVPERTFETPLDATTDANEDGRNRQHEIAQCAVGDELILSIEPRPRLQPNAVAVWSARTGGRIGYLPIDVAGYVLLHIKRNDFRTTIAAIETEPDEPRSVSLRIEVFAKPG